MTKSNEKTWQDPESEQEKSRYENPIPSRKLIAETIEGGISSYDALVAHFELEKVAQSDALKHRIKAMLRDGQLVDRSGDLSALEPQDPNALFEAVVQTHPKGFGFAVIEDSEDFFISAKTLAQVFNGDKIRVTESPQDARGKKQAVIYEILERRQNEFIGTLQDQDGLVVQLDQPNAHQSVAVSASQASHLGLNLGATVRLGVLSWPTAYEIASGKILGSLEDLNEREQIVARSLLDYEIPHEFSAKAASQAEAHKEPVFPDPSDASRRDLRELALVTIDGADSKDFDDAVFACKTDKGFRLQVAIADVSHYVKTGSTLDLEAYERGTSVYYPQQVIPMLPEVLSNGLCSLNPEVDRYALVCQIEFNLKGEVQHFEFYTAIMRSHARLTYDQVNIHLEGGDLPPNIAKLSSDKQAPVLDSIKALSELYGKLTLLRAERGAMDFDSPEVYMTFEESGLIDQILPRSRGRSHRIIEECMLAANICAAEFALKGDSDALYRNHLPPEGEKSQRLKDYLSGFGIDFPSEKPSHSDYQRVLKQIEDRPDADAIQTMLLRSMMQANYGPENQGHFGLAYEQYGHFTSPIRRYPDLIMHRAIKNHINKTDAPVAAVSIADAGLHLSQVERRADEATRDVMAWLKCDYMRQHLGEEFGGTVTGITNFGLFVSLEVLMIDGLVHISEIGDDYFEVDPADRALVGQKTGKRIRMGDPFAVRIAGVNMDSRQIDFVPQSKSVSNPASSAKASSGKPKRSGRGGKKR